MKKIFLLILLLCMMIGSCEKKFDNTCRVNDPVEELGWIKERTDVMVSGNPARSKYLYVSMADYQGQSVFIFGNCDPLALSVFPVFNCNGDFLGNVGEIPMNELTGSKVIWKTADSECSF